MILNDTYRKYFKHQAVHHPDLQHDDASGQRVFEVIDVEEALADFRSISTPKGYLMRLINYTYQIGMNDGADAQKYINGGFIIAKYHSHRRDGEDGFNTAMLQSEKIVDEIIEKMVADSRNGHPLFNRSLDTVNSINVQPKIYTGDSGYSGWICTFNISNYWRNCITHADAPAWTDNGQTPHNL